MKELKQGPLFEQLEAEANDWWEAVERWEAVQRIAHGVGVSASRFARISKESGRTVRNRWGLLGLTPHLRNKKEH